MARTGKRLQLFVMTLLVAIACAGFGYSQQASAEPAAGKTPKDCDSTFFGLVPWYHYMDREFVSPHAAQKSQADTCSFKCFNLFEQSTKNDCGQTRSDLPGLLLAIIDNLLRIAGFVALAFIFVGAFKYVYSEGDPEKTASARSTLINAFIGLAIAIFAVAFVGYIGGKLR